PCVEVQAAWPARLAYLLEDYAYLGDRPDWLAEQLEPLKPLHGKETIAAWQAMARAHELTGLFSALALQHYDPSYARSQRAHFRAWDTRRVVTTDDLSPAGIDAVARQIAAMGPALR